MPHPFSPGLPVLSDEERLRRNAIQQEWNNPFKDSSLDQRPSMANLYEDEPSVDELLNDAKSTLAEAPSSYNQWAASRIPDYIAEQEQNRLEQEASLPALARRTASAASIPASFLAGPVGAVAGGIQALDAIEGMADPDASWGGSLLSAGLAAFPAMRALRGADEVAGPIRKTGAEIGAKVSWPRLPEKNPNYRPGGTPGSLPVSETPPIPSSPMPYRPSSIAALADDSVEGAGRGSVDLTGALDDLGEAPLSPQEIARSRAAERFGRNFRSESTAEPGQNVVPFPQKARGFSEGEEQGMQKLDDLLTAIHGEDGVLPGNGTYVEPEDGRAALQRIINALYGPNPSPSVSRMTAQQALEEGDEISKRTSLFGGATSSEEGTFGEFVRPSKRTPIGARSPRAPRPGSREEAITWNPR